MLIDDDQDNAPTGSSNHYANHPTNPATHPNTTFSALSFAGKDAAITSLLNCRDADEVREFVEAKTEQQTVTGQALAAFKAETPGEFMAITAGAISNLELQYHNEVGSLQGFATSTHARLGDVEERVLSEEGSSKNLRRVVNDRHQEIKDLKQKVVALQEKVGVLEQENGALKQHSQDSHFQGLMLKALFEQANGLGSYEEVIHPAPRKYPFIYASSDFNTVDSEPSPHRAHVHLIRLAVQRFVELLCQSVNTMYITAIQFTCRMIMNVRYSRR